MLKDYKEQIQDADLVLVGIGRELRADRVIDFKKAITNEHYQNLIDKEDEDSSLYKLIVCCSNDSDHRCSYKLWSSIGYCKKHLKCKIKKCCGGDRASDQYDSWNGSWYRIYAYIYRNKPSKYLYHIDQVILGPLFFHAISDGKKFSIQNECLMGNNSHVDG